MEKLLLGATIVTTFPLALCAAQLGLRVLLRAMRAGRS
jgi:hypothetical protein